MQPVRSARQSRAEPSTISASSKTFRIVSGSTASPHEDVSRPVVAILAAEEIEVGDGLDARELPDLLLVGRRQECS